MYDRADRLRTASVGSTTETYTYAGDGTRLSASTGTQATQTTRYLWDRAFDLPQLALERDGNGALVRFYRHGRDLLSQTAGSTIHLYHHDGLGSVADITGSPFGSLWWREYYPYGLARHGGGTAPAVQPFNFTGEQLDPLTGLYHLRARQYDPSLGRFLAIDPMAAMISDPYVAAYVYARNNPCRYFDPSGLAAADTDRGIPCEAAIIASAGLLVAADTMEGPVLWLRTQAPSVMQSPWGRRGALVAELTGAGLIGGSGLLLWLGCGE